MKVARSGIDTQLKRRHDFIPRLVETVKGSMPHKWGLIEKIAGLRSKSIAAGSIKQKIETKNAMTDSLRSLFAAAVLAIS